MTAKLPMPPFVTAELTMDILMSLGGRATSKQITEYVLARYDCSPLELHYLVTKLGDLRRSAYVDARMDKKTNELFFAVTEQAKSIIAASR